MRFSFYLRLDGRTRSVRGLASTAFEPGSRLDYCAFRRPDRCCFYSIWQLWAWIDQDGSFKHFCSRKQCRRSLWLWRGFTSGFFHWSLAPEILSTTTQLLVWIPHHPHPDCLFPTAVAPMPTEFLLSAVVRTTAWATTVSGYTQPRRFCSAQSPFESRVCF